MATKLSEQIVEQERYLGGLQKRLSDKKYQSKAPTDIIQRDKANLEAGRKKKQELESQLAELDPNSSRRS